MCLDQQICFMLVCGFMHRCIGNLGYIISFWKGIICLLFISASLFIPKIVLVNRLHGLSAFYTIF